MVTQAQLRGMSREKAMLFGLPHIGARYIDVDSRGKPRANHYERLTDVCPICGMRATNCHHVVPRSVSKTFELQTPNGNFSLRSPLFALCGSGTTGCHNGFHGGAFLKATWAWDSQSLEDAWWSGELLAEYGAHNPSLFDFGRWEIEDSRYGVTIGFRGDERLRSLLSV